MPTTTVPAKTTITLRMIRPKLISDNSRMAAISLQRNRTIPTRTHRSSPRRDIPRTTRWATTSPAARMAMVSHMVSRLPTVRPSPHMARPLPLTGSRLSLRSLCSRLNLYSPSTVSRRTDLRIMHNRRRPPIISSRHSPNTRSPHTISRQPTRSRPTIRRLNSSPSMATRRSRRSSPACSACSSAPSACTTSIWDTPVRPWLSCC